MSSAPSAKTRIRQPHFADDMWYSASATTLKTRITNYLANPPLQLDPERVLGLVAPHAGHRFSGHVAGAGFASLPTGLVDTVILLGPDHRGAAPGRTSTPAVEMWHTPLGNIPVAWELLDLIKTEIGLVQLSDDDEHSLEVELPFLQTALGSFRLAPLMLGDQSRQTAERLSRTLVDAAAQVCHRPLFVASSDLSHFFDDDTARTLDQETIDLILQMNARSFLERVKMGRLQGQPLACGAGAIATVMLAARARGAIQAQLIKYATSADVHPDRNRVVGYAAIAFTR